jgi:hypothetical protein
MTQNNNPGELFHGAPRLADAASRQRPPAAKQICRRPVFADSGHLSRPTASLAVAMG